MQLIHPVTGPHTVLPLNTTTRPRNASSVYIHYLHMLMPNYQEIAPRLSAKKLSKLLVPHGTQKIDHCQDPHQIQVDWQTEYLDGSDFER